MNWTEEQRQVIDLRNCNILVSAAAGSGKTTVLIERIMSRITDPENPVNVDEFLIVTFTRAAASQMKERLQQAIEEALAADPDNEHLQRQIMLIPMAQISTIHSFCGYVIQNYFHRTGVDPSYRVGSDSELGLVKSGVMQELLEEKYEEASEEFMNIAAMSRFVKSDAQMEDLVLMLYEKAVSDPFPGKFLERMKGLVMTETVEELKESEFVQWNLSYVKNLLGGICEEYDTLLALCERPGGPFWYREVICGEREQLAGLLEETDYEELGKGLGRIDWRRLPAGKRSEDNDEELKETVKNTRTAIKDAVRALVKDLFDRPLEGQLAQLRQMRGLVVGFVDLTLEFMERYRAKKSEKALVDYSDLEQMALEILLEEDEDGVVERTEAAGELAEQFAEIMIDEYQDSNLVQELLLASVASERNRFMVGDIKQSIYRFRMACPELFLEKLDSYGNEKGAASQLINLSQNFRSRDIVIEGTNVVFDRIMRRELGGVEYDEAARLRTGAVFPETEKRTADGIDVYALEGTDDGTLEGRIIAGMIRDYTGEEDPLYVYEGGAYRPARYGDIVILMRSTKAAGQQIYDALASEGIPVHMENTRGFFDTREISVMVSMFQVIDNPRQDMPLAAVLKSPVFDFTDDELAILRGKDKSCDFYDSVAGYRGELELEQKAAGFLELLTALRDRMSYATVADLIQEIYDRTGIDRVLTAMKNGVQRKANLDLLMELAREFDRTSYRGLHQFVHYIRGIREREEDMGEANLLGSRDDVVRIMTIHKSKGLEFPVCILAGMGRSLSGGSRGGLLALSPSVGLAAPVVDNERGTSESNAFYRSILRMNQLEDLGEELRVLYVAMTRAKEKLVLVGCAKEDKVPCGTDYFQLIGAKSYFDWVLPAIRDNGLFRVSYVRPEELEREEIRRQADVIVDEVMLNNFDTTFTYDEEIKELLEFMEGYQEQEHEELPTKLTVSEIKRRSMEEQAEAGLWAQDEEELWEHDTGEPWMPDEEEVPVPHFAGSESGEPAELLGTGYGTVWHQVLAGLDFALVSSEKDVENELRNMVESGKLRAEDRKLIRSGRLMRFLNSPLGAEVKQAQEAGRLYREQPFVIRAPACEVLPDTKSRAGVLVQGIIDAFFEADGGIVLLDYKTDRLEPGQEDVLRERYGTQMELYAGALEKITGKRVIRRVLYSFSLNRAVEL